MRSSKSRSRHKPNRGNNNRSGGNVINRVFDSSGPEGKVRGTPQQIIDKYNQLARDAQLSGDRVATENFQQHAEHYLRLLGEAQKEQDQRREEQERLNRERQAERDRERAQRQERESNAGGSNAGGGGGGSDPSDAPQPDVIDPSARESDLVETPESQQPPKPKRPRKPRKKPASEAPQGDTTEARDGGNEGGSGPAEAAE